MKMEFEYTSNCVYILQHITEPRNTKRNKTKLPRFDQITKRV